MDEQGMAADSGTQLLPHVGGLNPSRTYKRGAPARSAGMAGLFLALCVALGGGGFTPAMASAPAEPVSAAASAPATATLMGYWLSQDHDGVFLIQQCGDVVCGHLVGMRYDGTDVPRGHDGKTECNIMMLTDFRPMKDNLRKLQGNILDPDTGHVYDAQIWTDGPDVLKLRGYLGLPLFGQTQTWTRYTGPAIGPMCKMR